MDLDQICWQDHFLYWIFLLEGFYPRRSQPRQFSKEGDESKSIGLKGPFLLFDTRKPKLQEKSGLVQSHAVDCIRAVEAGVFWFWTTDVLLWSFIFLAQFFGKLESAFVVGMCQGIRFFAQMIHAGSLHCPCDLYDGFLIQVCT